LESPYSPPIVTPVATQTALGDLGSFLQQMKINRRKDRINNDKALQAHMQYMEQ